MTEALAVAPQRSRLREWLRYDESLEAEVDAAFDDFIKSSKIVPVFVVSYVVAFLADIVLYAVYGRQLRQHLEMLFALHYACMYLPSLYCLVGVPAKTLRLVFKGVCDWRRSAAFASMLAIGALTVEMVAAGVLQSLHLYTREASPLQGGIVITLLVGIVFAPLVEEAFFQGWVQTRLAQRGTNNAEGVTTFLFVLFHLPRGLSSLLRGFGLFANAVVRKETRSLGAAAVAHFTNNVIAVGTLIAIESALHRPMHW